MSSEHLLSLLKLAGIQPASRQTWFSGGNYLAPYLYVDAQHIDSITRLFLPQLLAVRPTLTLLPIVAVAKAEKPKAPAYLNAKGRAAWTQQRLTD